MSKELDEISAFTGNKENSCSCNACKSLCHKTPCIGTPQDMINLVNNGYADQLHLTAWGAGLPLGRGIIHMVAPEFIREERRCTFLSPDGLCTLHSSGLKPAEGKLSTHVPKEVTLANIDRILSFHIANKWDLDNKTTRIAFSGIIRYTERQANKIRTSTFYLPESAGTI